MICSTKDVNSAASWAVFGFFKARVIKSVTDAASFGEMSAGNRKGDGKADCFCSMRGIAGVFSTVGISAERFPAANTTPAADKVQAHYILSLY